MSTIACTNNGVTLNVAGNQIQIVGGCGPAIDGIMCNMSGQIWQLNEIDDDVWNAWLASNSDSALLQGNPPALIQLA